MARTTPFKLRLLDSERADLDARAERDDLAKADVIRKAMGWPIVGLSRPSPAAGSDTPPPAKPSPGPASEEPGAAGVSELARRIEERKQRGG